MSSQDCSIYYLKIKTQKVQSFIFRVPRLKFMLGANSLLGEFFSEDLIKIRSDFSVPELWLNYIETLDLNEYKWGNDDLESNFRKGVICSAGGHFESLFTNEEEGKYFIEKAITKATEKIPGIKLSIHYYCLNNFSQDLTFKDYSENLEDLFVNTLQTDIFFDNPYFVISSEDGELPQLFSKADNHKNESYITKKIKEQGDLFYDYKCKDFLCNFLIENQIKSSKEIEDLKSLIPNNNKYAIIAIDGNAMGERFKKIREKEYKVFEAFVTFEKFWFSNRKKIRDTIKETFESFKDDIDNYKNRGYDFPFVILMLGGDDLLILSVPELAIPFTVKFSEILSKSKESEKEEERLSISAGVSFIKLKYPFIHGHQLAESLLNSAKIKSREWINNQDSPQLINAIDWHIHFTSGIIDIDEIRRENYYLQYGEHIEILTKRPYSINDADKIWNKSISLFKQVNRNDDEEKTGRNKYKRLRTLLKSGEDHLTLYSSLLGLHKDKIIDIKFEVVNGPQAKKVKISDSLDIIELMDFHKRDHYQICEGKNENA